MVALVPPDVLRHSDTWRAIATMAAFSLIGNTVLAVQPMVVGGLVDLLHFSERQAGFVAAAELLGFSLGGLALLTFVHKVDRRMLALAGAAVAACADIAASLIQTFAPMLLIRFTAGVGSVVAYSVFPVLAAASSNPERVFGIVNATSIAYAGVFVWVAPQLLHMWHLPGLFITMAILAVVVAPTIKWASPQTVMRSCDALGPQVGRLLGSSMLIWGVVGSLLASWLGLAIGRIWPQVLSLGASILAAGLLVFGGGALVYGGACALIAFSWFYGLPYQTGLLALFDPKGRANIAGDLASTLGSALGPALTASLLGVGGHVAIAGMAAGCYVVCLVLVLLSLRELARTGVCLSRGRQWQ
jgi:MFS family permease